MTRLALAIALVAAVSGCASRPARVRGIPAALVARTALDTSPIVLPAMREKTLPNGLTLLVLEDHELPVASIALFWPTGDTSDPPGMGGLSSVASSLLRQGTATRTAQEIADAIESVGGDLTCGSEMEWTALQARVLSRDLDLALDLITDIAQHPAFPADELEQRRRAFLGMAKGRLDDPDVVAARFAASSVYGRGNPYAADMTESSLQKIRREDVVAHAAKAYGPSGAILAVSGDVDSATLLPALEERLGGWTGTAAVQPEFPRMPEAKRQLLLVHKPGLTQSFIRVGLPAMSRRDPDYAAAVLVNNVLGGSYSSRLTRVIRADGGRTYDVSSWFTTRRVQGAFWVSTSTRTAETVATLDLVLREIQRIRDMGVSPAELANAKSNIAGSVARGFETGSDVLGQVVTARLMDMPLSSVTDWRKRIVETPLAKVNASARRWLAVESARIVVVGDARQIGPQLERAYGHVEVVDFRADPAGDR